MWLKFSNQHKDTFSKLCMLVLQYLSPGSNVFFKLYVQRFFSEATTSKN